MAETQKNIALWGCGAWGRNIARNLHAAGVLRTIIEPDPASRAALGSVLDGVEWASEPADSLADRTIEGIVIAAPAARHEELARLALESGRDVFVEKPLALSASGGASLVELADSTGRILMVGHLLRYHPAFTALERLIRGGELGRLQYVYSNRLNIGKIRREENSLWSFAPHDISVILALVGERPIDVSCRGGAYLDRAVADVTLSQISFPDGVAAHVFVSWLHPFKEQKLVVVGSRKMAVFDDLDPGAKLRLYSHEIRWEDGKMPVAQKANAEVVDVDPEEPLRIELNAFLHAMRTRSRPPTDGAEGLRVLEVLEACQRSLESGGRPIVIEKATPLAPPPSYFAHSTAEVDPGAEIGEGTKIWHFSHIMKGSRLGRRCNIGQNVVVSPGCVLGENVKVQNNVSIYTGVILEDDVFCGPSMVFTNVLNPRSAVNRKSEYRRTVVRRGASLGANSTIVCGHDIGRYAFVGAGAVVTKNVPDFALVVGNPARVVGWMCRCGERLQKTAGGYTCATCGATYRQAETGLVEINPEGSNG